MSPRTRSRPHTLTTTEAVVLGLLTEEERSGYDLLKRAEGSVAHMWAPAKSQLYAVLPRLVEDGLATVRTVRQSPRPHKNVYRVTADGKRTLRRWLEDERPRSWDELLLKVFFADLALPDAIVRHLEEYRELQQGFLEEYQSIRPRARFGALTLRFGLELMPVRIAWIDAALAELSQG